MGKINNLKTQFGLLYNDSELKCFLYDKDKDIGEILIEIDKDLYIIKTRLNKIDLEKTSLEEIKNSKKEIHFLTDKLNFNKESNFLCYNEESKTESWYKFIASTEVDDCSSFVYIMYNEEEKQLDAFLTDNNKTKNFIIGEFEYQSILNTFNDKTTDKELFLLKLYRLHINTFDLNNLNKDLSFVHNLFWIKKVFLEKGYSKEATENFLNLLIKEILYENNSNSFIYNMVEKTKKIKHQTFLEDETFIKLFNDGLDYIKFSFKFCGVEAVKDLKLLDKPFDINNFHNYDVKYILLGNYSFKKELFKNLIQSGYMMTKVKGEGRRQDRIDNGPIYLRHLLAFSNECFLNDDPNIYMFLEEALNILNFYNTKVGKTRDRLYIYDDNLVKFIDVDDPKKDLFYKAENYKIKPYEIDLNLFDNINLLTNKELDFLKILVVFNIVDLSKDKDRKKAIDCMIKHSIQFESLEELLIKYISSDSVDKEKIMALTDFEKIKEDLDFFKKLD